MLLYGWNASHLLLAVYSCSVAHLLASGEISCYIMVPRPLLVLPTDMMLLIGLPAHGDVHFCCWFVLLHELGPSWVL